MPKRGSNFIPLVLDTRLLMVINGKASQKKQLNATYIMSVLVEHCKNQLEPETYQQLKERYAKTVYQQKKEKIAKEKAKIKREKERTAQKERELRIKERTAESYAQQTTHTVNKEKQTERRKLLAEKRRIEAQIKRLKHKPKDKPNKTLYHLEVLMPLKELEAKLNEVNEKLDTASSNSV